MAMFSISGNPEKCDIKPFTLHIEDWCVSVDIKMTSVEHRMLIDLLTGQLDNKKTSTKE